MPKEKLTSNDLISDSRQGRYLHELNDHAEDAGGTEALGDKAILAQAFNTNKLFMSHNQLSTKDLVTDSRQDRFLQELSHHLEDSGSSISIGDPIELAETFNGYARPKRNQKIALIVFIGIIVFLVTSYNNFPHVFYSANASTFQNFAVAGVDVIATIFVLPWVAVMAFFYIPLEGTGIPSFLLDLPAVQTFFLIFTQLLPALTGLLWCGIAGFFLFPPRFLRQKIYAIFKRSTKRRA